MAQSIRVTVLAALVLVLQAATAAGQAEDAIDASRVSAGQIRRLRAKWIEPDAEATETDKIRRYEAMLREGRQILRSQGEAENLYMVQALMLQATRGLLILDAGEIDRQSVMNLAKDIVSSSAPPTWRIEADRLLTQVEMAQAYSNGEEVAQRIEKFAAKYENTDMQAVAIMTAAEMAHRYRKPKLYEAFIDRLKEEMMDFEGVGAFLIRHGQKVPRTGRSFRLRLAKLSGGRMELPLEAMGKTSVIVVWDPGSDRSKRYVGRMASFLAENSSQPLRGIGIAISDNPEAVKQAAEEISADFPQLLLPPEELKSVAEFLGVTEVPFCFVLGADGRIQETPHGHLRMRWSEAEAETRRIVQQGWRKRARLQDVRSGLNLAGLIHPEVGEPLAGAIRELLSARLLPSGKGKSEAMKDVASKLKNLQLTKANDQGARDVLLVALERWQALGEDRNRMQSQWSRTAQSALEKVSSDAAKLLAEYFVLLESLESSEPAQVASDLEEFVLKYDEWGLSVPARIFAVAASCEAGVDATRQRYSHQLSMNFPDHPKSRGFLRDVFYQKLEYERRQIRDLAFTGLDGKVFRTGQELAGKTCVIHFWSEAGPIGSAGVMKYKSDLRSHYTIQQVPEKEAVIIAVNVDGDMEAAKALARKHPQWHHAICPDGWFDPSLRALDVTMAPSSWILGDRGVMLVNDNEPDYVERLENVVGMSRWLATWRADTADSWYYQASKTWVALQAYRAERALLGMHRDLAQMKRFAEQNEWAVTRGATRAFRRTASELHRQVIDWAARYQPAGPDLEPEALEQLKVIWRDFERLEPMAQRIHEMTHEPEWPDSLPESQVPQALEQIHVLHMRRGQVPDSAEKALQAVFGDAGSDSGHIKVNLKPFWQEAKGGQGSSAGSGM